jgi:hypothetical protein
MPGSAQASRQGPVGRASVAGEQALDGDAARGEPGRRPAQHTEGGGCGLVVMDVGYATRL